MNHDNTLFDRRVLLCSMGEARNVIFFFNPIFVFLARIYNNVPIRFFSEDFLDMYSARSFLS